MHPRLRLGLLMAPFALPFAARAQDAYPARPIRMVIPFGPGGPTDLVARLAAEGMGRRLGQTVVADNRPGAAGRIGLEAIAAAAPDGYTIGFIAGTLGSLQAFSKDWKRDVVSSYAYVGSLVESNSLLWAPANAPGRTLGEMLAHYKANPGVINIAYTAPGPHELVIRHLDAKWGLKATRINYKGTAEAKVGLLGGDVQILIDGVAGLLPDYRAGKLKPLVVLGPKRLAELPDVPTLAETRTADHDIDTTALFGVIAPAGVPEAMVAKLGQALAETARDAETLARIRNIGGLQPTFRAGAEFRSVTRNQAEVAMRLAKEYGIEPM